MVDPSALAGRASTAPQWLQVAMAPFAHGNLAVAAFIVISGFSLQLALFKRGDGRVQDLKAWLKRRALRILPPYYACLVASLVVCFTVTQTQEGMPWELYLPVTPFNVLTHGLLIHNWWPDHMYKINGVLWSIAIEAQLYLLFPVLAWIMWRLGRFLTVAFLTALVVGSLALSADAAKLYPWFLPLFAFGMLAAYLAYRPNLQLGVQPSAAGVVAFFALMWTVWAAAKDHPLAYRDMPLGIATAALLYLYAVQPDAPVARWLSKPWMVWLGSFSYSLYLMHHPLQQVLYVVRPAWVQGPIDELSYLLVVGLPAILIVCRIFALVFEGPSTRAGRKAERKRSRSSVAPAGLRMKGANDMLKADEKPPKKPYSHAVVNGAGRAGKSAAKRTTRRR
jgi:peptidoglycan/LPS O-acetylase OafA/YrhL